MGRNSPAGSAAATHCPGQPPSSYHVHSGTCRGKKECMTTMTEGDMHGGKEKFGDVIRPMENGRMALRWELKRRPPTNRRPPYPRMGLGREWCSKF